MVSRVKRRASSLTYFLRKTYWKVVTAKPSLFVVAVVGVAFSIFLLAGGVYDILEKPIMGFPLGRRVLFYYPYTIHEQVLLESFLVMTIYAFGFTGFLLTYQSTKYAYKPRQAFILLMMGLTLIFIAYLGIETALNLRFSA